MTSSFRRLGGAPTRPLGRAWRTPPSRPRQQRSTGRPPVILIADDISDTRDLYKEHFASRGFTVVTANDGVSAVQAVLEHEPDVIVMDLAMPQIDGLTAVRRINAGPRPLRSRVILLTGYPHNTAERDALEAGADLFLTKPCLPETLEDHVNRLRQPSRPVSGTRLP